MSKKVSAITPCYRSEKYIDAFLENLACQSTLDQLEVVMDLNDPSSYELEAIEGFRSKHPDVLKINIVRPVQPVSTSMNNCLAAASGAYICIWNVDDARSVDSIEMMVRTLDENPDKVFTYGDYIKVNLIGSRRGNLIPTREFDRAAFRVDFELGPFFMWRNDNHLSPDRFDEQFKSGADFDFAIRLAMIGDGIKTEGIIGYYLDIGEGASTGGDHLPQDIVIIERKVVQLRYGMWNRLDLQLLEKVLRYDVMHIHLDGERIPVWRSVPGYEDILSGKERQLIVSYARTILATHANPIWELLRKLFTR